MTKCSLAGMHSLRAENTSRPNSMLRAEYPTGSLIRQNRRVHEKVPKKAAFGLHDAPLALILQDHYHKIRYGLL